MFDLVLVGFAIIIAGFFMLLLAMFFSGSSTEEERSRTGVRGGGVIMIGPIPIILGSDAKWASIALVLAVALVVLLILVEALGA